MVTFIRVRDRETGHEFDIAETAYRESKHIKVNAPKQYPPLTSDDVRRVTARPAKHRTDKAGDLDEAAGDDQTEETSA